MREFCAEYTEVFADFLKNHPNNYLEEIFVNFPAFKAGEVTIDFVTLFKNRNLYKEIGSETEELFDHNLRRLAQELYVKNAVQINAFLAMADKFTQRSIDEEDIITDYQFLNPIDGNSVDLNTAVLAGATKRKSNFQVWLGGNKSNAEMVKEIADIYSLYNDMLNSFDILFMGVH